VGSVGITGLGYVGLPLAAAFAEAGLSVVGIEKDPDKVAALEGGDSYVEDVPSARLAPLLSSARLRATGDYPALGEAGAVLVCLPTPLDAAASPTPGA
jgi:UDP-N-acetyl-D-glucosamine dehydrogenase